MLTIHTSAACRQCGHWLDYHKGYFLCPKCRTLCEIAPENIKYNLADYYELNIPYTSKKFNNRLEQLQKLCNEYEIHFLGFDPFEKINSTNSTGMLNIGWTDGFPENLYVIVKKIKSVLR